MPKPVEVRVLEPYRIHLRFDDGTEGTLDLGDLAGRGVFAAWRDTTFFRQARIGPHGQLSWGDRVDLCPDALYMRLTGRSPDEVLPALKKAPADA